MCYGNNIAIVRDLEYNQTMSFEVMKLFEDAGFKLKELIIKEQHNCRATVF